MTQNDYAADLFFASFTPAMFCDYEYRIFQHYQLRRNK